MIDADCVDGDCIGQGRSDADSDCLGFGRIQRQAVMRQPIVDGIRVPFENRDVDGRVSLVHENV